MVVGLQGLESRFFNKYVFDKHMLPPQETSLGGLLASQKYGH